VNRLTLMETFVRVVDSRSFSAAAHQLNMGQPAVSKMVAQLERRLGVQLLLRSTQKLAPTRAGQIFYEGAKHAIEAADAAETAARGANATLTGELRVSAAVTFARLHIVPRLGQFFGQHPALTMKIMLDDKNIDLIEAGVDVALRMGPLDDSTLIARRIAQCPRLVLATPAYFEMHDEPKAPSDLLTHQAIIYSVRGGGTSWTFRKRNKETSVDLPGRLEISAAEGVREAVLSGLGFAIASEWMFFPELKRGAVRAVLQDWTLPSMDLWAVFPTRRRISAKARAFVAFVEGAVRESKY
jgi:DNA-binding transcriptional LysR family regulator